MDLQKAVDYAQNVGDFLVSPYAAIAFYGLLGLWIVRKVYGILAFAFSLLGKLAFGLNPFAMGSLLIVGGLATFGFGIGAIPKTVEAVKVSSDTPDAQLAFVERQAEKREQQALMDRERDFNIPAPIFVAMAFSGFGILLVGLTVFINSFDTGKK